MASVSPKVIVPGRDEQRRSKLENEAGTAPMSQPFWDNRQRATTDFDTKDVQRHRGLTDVQNREGPRPLPSTLVDHGASSESTRGPCPGAPAQRFSRVT